MITIITDDSTYPLDVDPASITLENVQAILEADSAIPATRQLLSFSGQRLEDPQRTLESYGVKDGDLIMCQLKPSQAAAPAAGAVDAAAAGGPTAAAGQAGASLEERQAQALREQVLSNPQLLAQLNATRPDLASALLRNPAEFVTLLRQSQSNSLAPPGSDEPFDEFSPEAQRRIEEAIRQEAISENLESAMEFNPESFGRVTMLYVDAVVNGEKVKAFVDSGAQATIMSPDCAERCGLMRLLDTRFAGIARGVGTAKILGRVHSAQIKLGDELFLPCSFTIMEGKGVELLFGLDMLKRFQATIDLASNALVIDGKRVRFLDEHELPASARMDEEPAEGGEGSSAAGAAGSSAQAHGAASANANAAAQATREQFPGGGRPLGGTGAGAASGAAGSSSKPVPESSGVSWTHGSNTARSSSTTPAAAASAAPSAPTAGASSHPESSIKSLTDLGATPAQAKALLDAAGGNVEVAASLLFQG